MPDLQILIKSVIVANNGGTPDPSHLNGNAKPATIGLTLSFQRPNTLEIQHQSSVVFPIDNNTLLNFDTANPVLPTFGPVEALLDKVTVQGATSFRAVVSYAPSPSLFAAVLKGIYESAGVAAIQLVPGGAIVTASLQKAVDIVVTLIKDHSDTGVQPIGDSGPMAFDASRFSAAPQEIRIPLTAPQDIHRSWFERDPNNVGNPFRQVSGTVITKGQANGEVVLLISTI